MLIKEKLIIQIIELIHLITPIQMFLRDIHNMNLFENIFFVFAMTISKEL